MIAVEPVIDIPNSVFTFLGIAVIAVGSICLSYGIYRKRKGKEKQDDGKS